MSIYHRFAQEVTNGEGRLLRLTLDYPGNFNFGYDVVDALAEESPEKIALVWCNTQGEERRFTFRQLRRESNRMANVLSRAGIGQGPSRDPDRSRPGWGRF